VTNDETSVDREDLARLAEISESIMSAMESARTPLVYPAGSSTPEPRWVHMGECRYCGDDKPKRLYWKLTATGPVGTFGLFGSQPTANCVWWPWAECEACGHQSQGKVKHAHDDP
jgi:hypothetical protein